MEKLEPLGAYPTAKYPNLPWITKTVALLVLLIVFVLQIRSFDQRIGVLEETAHLQGLLNTKTTENLKSQLEINRNLRKRIEGLENATAH